MSTTTVAQSAFDKCMSVTPAARREELAAVFSGAGITISGGSTVTGVSSDDALTNLVSELKSVMPTAAMTVKREIHAAGL
ncbi:MAG: hypothetical protein GY929_01310 [Actinomycetia bacterium]|nr:hypothetical protein [Actinomycetes bacterium]